MTIEKKTLDKMDRCYAVAAFKVSGRMQLFYASEGHGPCYMYDAETLERKVVWEEPGGTMCIVPLENTDGDFLAVQHFFPTFQAQNSVIVRGHFDKETQMWNIQTILSLPYIHRFDVLHTVDQRYLIVSTLATSKKDKEDWSDPGKVYVAKLPNNLQEGLSLTVILEGLVKNHGYSRIHLEDGMPASLVSCESGIYKIIPPKSSDGDWNVTHLIEQETSDVCMMDMDNDGNNEIAVIEGFHGSTLKIYKEINQHYTEVYHCKRKMNFIHAIWAGTLRGVPTMIFGYRRHALELFLVQYDIQTKEYYEYTLDIGTGPSNVTVVNGPEFDLILSSSRHIGEAALYYVYD
jgi:hypothetical protein